MKCPHCDVGINLQYEYTSIWVMESANKIEKPKEGYDVASGHCPECNELIVLLRNGMPEYNKLEDEYYLDKIIDEKIIYPKFSSRKVETEVPERYKKDFIESCSVLQFSPKASAALSRRILQDILSEKFEIKSRSLDKQIETFIAMKDTPSYLAKAIDAVRNIGNFAAHPLKDTNTGEIVEVEPGEAEWLLEVLEGLFDFTFVQPIRLEKKKNALNQKLQSIGKPPMKEGAS